jgi:LysM repeat protein
VSGGGESEWRRYAAPAAFLLAVTIAIVLIRSGLQAGGRKSNSPTTTVSRTRTATSAATTTAKTITTKRPPAKRFYTVIAGDTFSVISRKTGVPVVTIEQLNPGISSTSLHIGERVRIG